MSGVPIDVSYTLSGLSFPIPDGFPVPTEPDRLKSFVSENIGFLLNLYETDQVNYEVIDEAWAAQIHAASADPDLDYGVPPRRLTVHEVLADNGWVTVDITGVFRIRVTEDWLRTLSRGRDVPADPNNSFSTPNWVMRDLASFSYIRFGEDKIEWEGCDDTNYDGYRPVRPDPASTPQPSDEQVRRAAELLTGLKRQIPDNVRHLIRRELHRSWADPEEATRDQAWDLIWPRAVLTGPYQGSGEPIPSDLRRERAERLRPEMGDALAFWGDGTGRYDVSVRDPGALRPGFQALTDGRLIPVPEERFLIQNAAIALRARAESSDYPVADLPLSPPEIAMRRLSEEFGYGWGMTRCYDILAAFGLTLTRSAETRQMIRDLGLGDGLSLRTVEDYLILTDRVRSVLRLSGSDTPRGLRETGLELIWTVRVGSLSRSWRSAIEGRDWRLLDSESPRPDPF
jgi:hypothetical protein